MASGARPGMGGTVDGLAVSFYGVRGSTPCCAPEVYRYGGNTSCVVLDAPGMAPLLLDLGTGVRVFGQGLAKGVPFHGRALVSHLHWDHVQGLPFFGPALCAGNRLDIYAPPPGCGMTLAEAFDTCIRPPFFPVTLSDLPGATTLHEAVLGERFELDGASVLALAVPHVGPTVGYRIDVGGVSVAYIPDHQQPADTSRVDPAVLALADGVDLLIHDAQYTAVEFAEKATWGHSTVSYAVEVARQAQVGKLALFHHDPLHDDDTMDGLLAEARIDAGCAFEVVAAHEGMRLTWPCHQR